VCLVGRVRAKRRPEQVQQKALLDDLVGAGEQRWRDFKAKRPRGFEIDY
jgi:hypothetical protein